MNKCERWSAIVIVPIEYLHRGLLLLLNLLAMSNDSSRLPQARWPCHACMAPAECSSIACHICRAAGSLIVHCRPTTGPACLLPLPVRRRGSSASGLTSGSAANAKAAANENLSCCHRSSGGRRQLLLVGGKRLRGRQRAPLQHLCQLRQPLHDYIKCRPLCSVDRHARLCQSLQSSRY